MGITAGDLVRDSMTGFAVKQPGIFLPAIEIGDQVSRLM